ncbi:MAG: hypothetical protein HQ567_33900 [Candidatus Nealsonbacteria bacterium]|nr:hypothetical protein [Candidatus Nealsonbacteria bacterium]
MANRIAGVQSLGLGARVGLLIAVDLVLLAVVVSIAGPLAGTTGVVAATVAAGVCLLGAVPALIVSRLLQQCDKALQGMGFAMLLRMAIPLGFAMVIHFQDGGLAAAGFLYYLLMFYPVTLGVETVLSLPKTDPPGRRSDGTEDVA